MDRRTFIGRIAGALLAAPLAAEAQQAAKVARMGYLAGNVAAKQATTTIPIVFAAVGDPVTSGLVTSLARPGGNVTGLSNLHTDLVGKCLEQLKQTVPGVTRVAALWPPGVLGERTDKDVLKAADLAARALGARVQFVEARGPPISTGPSRT